MTHINPTSTHDVISPATPVLLNKPVLDLDVTAVNPHINGPRFVAALPEGEAAVVNDGSQVVKINNTGQTIKELYNCQLCNNIQGLLLLGSNLYVTHSNGTIVEIQPQTDLLNVFHIPDVGGIYHYGSLWSDPSKIPNTDILLLPDRWKDEVFSYNLTSRYKQVHLTGLSNPTSVSYSFYNNTTLYVVCQHSGNTITIYNSFWDLVSSFGDRANEYLYEPLAAIISPNNSILVNDDYHNRISVYTTDGVFLYYLLTRSDGINYPTAISYYKPYLWLVNSYSNELHRYRLLK